MSEEQSELLTAIQERKRPVHEFEVNGLVGLSKEPIRKVAIRVATKREQDLAIAGAHAYVAKLAEKTPSVASDPDVLLDAKACYILATVLRDPGTESDPNRSDKMPIFPTGEVIADKLSTEQIAALIALANQVRRIESPAAEEIGEDLVQAVVQLCSSLSDTDLPEAALARFTRVQLEQLIILLCMRLDTARKIADTEPVPA